MTKGPPWAQKAVSRQTKKLTSLKCDLKKVNFLLWRDFAFWALCDYVSLRMSKRSDISVT